MICISVHAQDSTLLRLEGNVIESFLKTSIKYPTISIFFNPDLKYVIQGDSSGLFLFERMIPKKSFELMVKIEADGKYMGCRHKLSIDTNNAQNIICREFEISPLITCIDTWILPDLPFEMNKTKFNKYIYFNDREDSLWADSVIIIWSKRFLNNPNYEDQCIEIVSYSDYNERENVSKKRLEYVYKKLIDAGIPPEKLILTNRNKEKRNYYKYRDGCFPYYLVDNQPFIIDQELIKKTENDYDRELYSSLRRVVTFNWKRNKN
ncbi:MAG: hypothetical protein CVU05_06750 [Bacteroidetes bacterium HGW-Bacteroidetes-21]|nr:MAG: hypothetical protein CVU05_06750 [Bacteroidetes bacterium HGW-Bacteroidetes-21]